MAKMTDTGFKPKYNGLISEKYVEMRPSMLSYVRRHTGNRCEAEDIYQEAFAKLLECRTVPIAETIERLIRKICRNLIVDWYRKHALSMKAQEFFSRCRPAERNDTDEAVIMNEMLDIETACIRKMGTKKSNIYLLYIHRGKTSGEISAMLGLSKRTVENHIFAARNIIRRELKKAL